MTDQPQLINMETILVTVTKVMALLHRDIDLLPVMKL